MIVVKVTISKWGRWQRWRSYPDDPCCVQGWCMIQARTSPIRDLPTWNKIASVNDDARDISDETKQNELKILFNKIGVKLEFI